MKKRLRDKKSERRLIDLDSVGPRILADFEKLGVHSVRQLAQSGPEKLYLRLCKITGVRQDPCVLDTFSCAVAQARDPQLPAAQRRWYWWSRKRKSLNRTI